jgi:predicted amidohydrolase
MLQFAAVQFKAAKGDWDASVARLSGLVDDASGAALVVCPEMALTGYVFPDEDAAREVAEPFDGRTFQFASDAARRLQAYLVIGYPEAGEDGRLFNSALVIAPDGSLLYNYRKRLLYEQDETWAQPGDIPYPLIETPFGLLTCGICMDLNDERFIDFLYETGPDVIAFPTNWLDQGFDIRPYWRWRMDHYPGWLVAANTYGTEEQIRFRGCSAILDPLGQTVAMARAEGDAVITG